MVTNAKLRKGLAYFLTFSLCLSLSQVTVFAAEGEESSVQSQVQGSATENTQNELAKTVTMYTKPMGGSISADYGKFKTYTPTLSENTEDIARDLAPHSPDTDSVSEGETADGKFSWSRDEGGYGIGSNIRIKTVKNTLNGRLGAHQFVLKNGENKYYVYCADLFFSPKNNAKYNMQRIEDTDYYQNCGVSGKSTEQIQDQIRTIVLNGYWGTEANSAGSLEVFKQMLTDSGKFTEDEVVSLTDGMALTATQAAIWYYGNSNGDADTVSDADIVGMYKSSASASYETVDDSKAKLVNKIYGYLINKDGAGLEPQAATTDNTLLAKDDFAQSITLAVGEKNADGKYLSDIAIGMKQIAFDGLRLSVKTVNDSEASETNIVGEYELSETEYSNGAYHLKGLVLPEDTWITLCFGGRQTLENGVYLFSSYKTGSTEPASQTFIGAGRAEQEIDLSIAFSFSVTEPTTKPPTHETKSPEPDSYPIERSGGGKPAPGDSDKLAEETEPKDSADRPDQSIIKTNTDKKSDSSKPSDDAFERVKKNAEVPKTGDINAPLAFPLILTSVSLAGCLTLLKRKARSK